MNLARNIRRIRNERGLSLNQLGAQIGVSGGYLSEMERGVKNINARQIAQISEALECSPGDLFPYNDRFENEAANKEFAQLTVENKRIAALILRALLAQQR